MSKASIGTLIRSTAVAVLLVAPTLSAFAADDMRLATNTSAQRGSAVHTQNEPDWQNYNYKTLP
jgi:hypothetical protein